MTSSRRAPTQAYAVIMAGGIGTRFWPRSRRRRPKQFLAIRGSRTLLQETVERLKGLIPLDRIFLVAPRDLAPLIREQLPKLPRANLIIEPAARGTAACIALAAAVLARRDPNAVMAVFPADHVIDDRRRFQAALRRAFATAEKHRSLVTFGIKPDRPDTGFGYIERGGQLGRERPRVFTVAGFREKPDARTARRYVAGGHLWNSGIFVWRADVLRDAFVRHAPPIAKVMDMIGSTGSRRRSAAERSYRRLAVAAVDRAIMEKAPNVAVVEATFDWSDVGSWDALADVWGKDAHGNARRGPALTIDSRDTVLFAQGRLIAAVGVDDLIVVDSPDAILVCRKSRSQDVRRVVEMLAHTGFRSLL
jgi:mannose-1-phosphate guanylyltransferase